MKDIGITIKVTCAAKDLAASAPQTFSASSEPPGWASYMISGQIKHFVQKFFKAMAFIVRNVWVKFAKKLFAIHHFLI